MLTLPTEENPDKKNLIESMKKLSKYLSSFYHSYVSDTSNRQT